MQVTQPATYYKVRIEAAAADSVEKETAVEKGTRIMKCPNCLPEVTRIRIKVTVEIYGKTVRVHCTKCLESFDVEIPVPAAEPEQAPKGFQFEDLFGDWLKPKK